MSNMIALRFTRDGDDVSVSLDNPLTVPPSCAALAFAARGLDLAEQILAQRELRAGPNVAGGEAVIYFPPPGFEIADDDGGQCEFEEFDGDCDVEADVAPDVELSDYLDAANRISMTLDVGDAFNIVGGLADPVCVLAQEVYALLEAAIESASYRPSR